ncbi:hypothetical protein GALL_266850 [mine drainage metagenome]|uniref:DUF3024 domain-containing protein n=1 Tax=mine drainage metagenome TaxID=410659 RepID=A0A1J5RPI4_9ZZZZ
MAFNELDRKRIENAMGKFLAKRRPPPHIRPELDIGFRLIDQSVEIFEIRPQWDDPSIVHQYPIAKTTYVRTRNLWKIFWQRADLKWHGYEPASMVKTIDEFLAVVDADPYGCFFG